MRKITLITVMFFFCAANFAQTVDQKQMALMFERTATWCNPCGTWGWVLFDDIWTARENAAVIFELHSTSSQLYCSTGDTIDNYIPYVNSVPAYYVNMKNETQYSPTGGIYTSTTKTRVIAVIDSTAAASPVVNSGFNVSVVNDSLLIDTKVKFFQNATGEYYLGVYIAEKDVIKYQDGIGNNAVHKQPLRGSALANKMGDLIVNGSVTAGTEFTSSVAYKVPSTWSIWDLRVFTVIWKKNGSVYEYVNAYKGGAGTGIHSLSDIQCDGLLYPSVASSQQSIKLNIDCLSNEEIKIDIMDQLGRNVNSIYKGKTHDGKNSFELNNGLKPGIYFVSLTANTGKKTYRFIITD